MTHPSTETTPTVALGHSFLGPFLGLFSAQGLTAHGLHTHGRAWRWPLVLSVLIVVLYLALSHNGFNPWASVAATQSLLADTAALSTHFLKAFAKPPWQWPSAYSVGVFGVTQGLAALGHHFKTMGLFGALPVIQAAMQQVPCALALLGIGLWFITLRALLHRWGWPPIARWAALTVLATHPAVWASALTGAGWQGTLWTLLLLKAPSLIESSPKALRTSRRLVTQQPMRLVTRLVTPSVVLGCLLGGSLWLLGPCGFMGGSIVGFVGAVATVTLLALVFKKAQPRITLSLSALLRPFFLTLALLGLISGLAALITQTPFAPFSLFGSNMFSLKTLPWDWPSVILLGGPWLLVAFVVTLFHPAATHLRLWEPHLRVPPVPAHRAKDNPALCWPKAVWISGMILATVIASPPLGALWLCIGISQPLATLNAEAPLKGTALRWLDALGIALILLGLAAAVVLFQWCPDGLPWITDTLNQTLNQTFDNQSLVSISLGSLAWEVAWWKLIVSGWLFSILILGFALLLRGHSLTVQQGLGLTTASVLWVGVVLNAGVLPWIQPTPSVPSGLTSHLQQPLSMLSVSFNPALAPSTQQMVVQTVWHSIVQSRADVTTQPLLKTLPSKPNTLQAVVESQYYPNRAPNQQAIAFQQVPVLRLWPHPTRGWLDAESIVWVISSPTAFPSFTAAIPHT